jgi:putative CocE/NonD family hydrolase
MLMTRLRFTCAVALYLAVAVGYGPAARADYGAGTQGRQWVAGPESPPADESPAAYAVSEQDNLQMTDSMGGILSYNLYLPEKAPVGPCLLIQEGYGKSSGNALDDNFASRGYAVVDSDLPGLGGSSGYWYPFGQQEIQAGYDMVEWMARQPWCNGRVGTFGVSYMAIDQFLTAKALPPHLKAMIPEQGWGDAYNGYYYPGGWQKQMDGDLWQNGFAQEGQLTPTTTSTPPNQGDVSIYMDHLLNEPSGLRYTKEVNDHPNMDGFWETASTLASDQARMADAGIAIMFLTGWNDLMTYPESVAYQQFAAAGGQRLMVIGPWTHGSDSGVEPLDFQDMMVLWFDHYLKGITNGIDSGPRALLYIPGPNQWRYEKDWPIPDAHQMNFYFDGAKAGVAQSQNDGTLTTSEPSAAETPDSYTYSPTAPDTAGPATLFANEQGQEAGSSAVDQRPFQPLRLTYTTAPLKAPEEITGPITVHLWVSCTPADPTATSCDPDFVARLVDVAPNTGGAPGGGTAIQISRGWVDVAHYPDEWWPKPLAPGEIRKVDIQIWPTSNVFDAGHRIQIDIGGSDSPLMTLNPQAQMDTIYHDSLHPSGVDLPLIGTWEGVTS